MRDISETCTHGRGDSTGDLPHLARAADATASGSFNIESKNNESHNSIHGLSTAESKRMLRALRSEVARWEAQRAWKKRVTKVEKWLARGDWELQIWGREAEDDNIEWRSLQLSDRGVREGDSPEKLLPPCEHSREMGKRRLWDSTAPRVGTPCSMDSSDSDEGCLKGYRTNKMLDMFAHWKEDQQDPDQHRAEMQGRIDRMFAMFARLREEDKNYPISRGP